MNGLGRILSRTAMAGALFGAVFLLASGPGTRLGLWELGTGFLMFQLGLVACVIGVLAAFVFGLVALFARTMPGAGRSLLAAVIAGVAAAFPLYMLYVATTVPPIHDITTDLEDPPAFVAVLPLREGAANPPDYEGGGVARDQERAYPDVKPLLSEAPAGDLYARALEVVRALGWELVDANAADGRIEATVTSFFFGFKDDIVIRVRSEGMGSRLDIRSKSRVGKSDLGANAARIRTFLKRLDGA